MRFSALLFLLATAATTAEESNNLRRKTYILPEDKKKEDEHRVFVQYKPGSKSSARSLLNKRSATTKLIYEFDEFDSFVVTTNEKDLKTLRADPNINSDL